jgi:L-threonylcarbamoyladenylate synthase
MGVVDEAVATIKSGLPVVLPADTVYGLCATPYHESAVRRVYRLKGKPETSPMALVASDLERLFECVPELRGRAGTIARALLPGPYTLVLANPARRFRWLAGSTPEAIGVRVPELHGEPAEILRLVGAVAATSANLHGEPDPRTLDAVPAELRSGCGAVVEGGELPGRASTVIDFTGRDPRVLREGAAPAARAIERAAAALG